jgi:predicted nucleic acid-binding protein
MSDVIVDSCVTAKIMSIYDALFVALVQDLQLSGVTGDEPLWQAVRADFPNVMLLRDWP